MKICYNCFNRIPDGAKFCPRCGTSADLRNGDQYPHALPCGTSLGGRYIVGRVLGQGGFGITYIGQQFDTKKLVAIKEYFPDTMAVRHSPPSVMPFNTDRREGFEYGKKQFLDEAKTLSAFIGSPNIVRVYSYFEENGTAYFVMEYVRGTNLGQYVVSHGGRIPWEEAWALLMPVLDALSEVHFRNIIHRDIKPDNILITGNGSAKLIDFGAARYTYNEKSKSLTAVLTPGYAPLEQYFSRGKQGPWTDVYALAATIYFCITGKVPVESVERSVDDALGKPSELGAAIPPYAEAALMKALAVREEDRYRSTYDFRNAVLAGKLREEEGSPGTGNPDPGNAEPAEGKNVQERSWEDRFRKIQDQALQGDPGAQYLLGCYYESGEGGRQDDQLAIEWYRRAADRGNAAARVKLDLLTEKETGGGQDNEKPGNGPQPPKKDDAGRQQAGTGKSGGPGTSGGGHQKKRAADRTRRIILVLGLIALIAAAGSVIPNGDRGQSSGTGTDSTNQITGGSDNTGAQEAVSAEEEKEEEEPARVPRSPDVPSPQDKEEEEPARISRSSDAPMELSDTWEEIAEAGRDGTYRERYRIGDTKELDMGSEGIITMKLVAMDEDELADGSGKAPMTWVADELLKSKHNMNSENTNEGGWEACEMRAWLREEVLPLMPEEVRDNIREVTKYSSSRGEQKGVASRDTIWIPSLREVFPAGYEDWTDEQREKEGVSYSGVIKDDESRVRSRDGESGASWWCLRSASLSTSKFFRSFFVGVDSDGSYSYIYANNEGGVVVGFCLGEVVESSDSVSVSRTSDAPMELTNTWEEIAAACREGTYKERYRIGDTKELDMGSEGIITMKLVAMDEDELSDGSGKAPMTWVADELLKSKHNMNSENTNKGGWEASEMRAWLRGTVLPLMPEEVRDNIREVTKYSYSYEEQKGVASKDTIWIPSLREVFPAGQNDWADERREKEGVSYTSVFTDNASRRRSREGESGARWWWLRSASDYSSHIFNTVTSDGGYYYGSSTSAPYKGGVVVGFCF